MDVYINFTKKGTILKRKWYPYHILALEAYSMKVGKKNIYLPGIRKFRLIAAIPGNEYYVLVTMFRSEGVTIPNVTHPTVYRSYSEGKQAIKNVHKGRKDYRFRSFLFGLMED